MPSILSININNQETNKFELLIQKLNENSISLLPDLIFTQEHNKYFLNNISKSKSLTSSRYKEYYCYGNHCERIGVFYNINKIRNPQKDIKVIANFKSTSHNYQQFPLMTRYGFIIEYKNVTIANIHLEGGRYSDVDLHTNENIKELTKFKMELLKDVVSYNPDIILGDFNSQQFINNYDIIDNTLKFENPIDEERFNYFKQYIKENIFHNLDTETEKLLAHYNSVPHKYLEINNYISRCNNADKVNSSSIGKSVIDAIYLKSNTILPKLGCIIDCGDEIDTYFGGFSDHNPIYLKYVNAKSNNI